MKSARALGEQKAIGLLEQNLKQEKEALRWIEKLTTRLTKERTTELAPRELAVSQWSDPGTTPTWDAPPAAHVER